MLLTLLSTYMACIYPSYMATDAVDFRARARGPKSRDKVSSGMDIIFGSPIALENWISGWLLEVNLKTPRRKGEHWEDRRFHLSTMESVTDLPAMAAKARPMCCVPFITKDVGDD